MAYRVHMEVSVHIEGRGHSYRTTLRADPKEGFEKVMEVANLDDGSCVYPTVYGCIDSLAYNYDSLANTDDGSCEVVVYGCTDIYASNYSSGADADDGSCYGYPNNGENSILFSDQNDYVVLPNDYDFTDQISYSFSVGHQWMAEGR